MGSLFSKRKVSDKPEKKPDPDDETKRAAQSQSRSLNELLERGFASLGFSGSNIKTGKKNA